MSAGRGLFVELADQMVTPPELGAAPAARLRMAQRDQPEFQVVDLESLLPPDHQARAVWDFVAARDLSALLAPDQSPRGRAETPTGRSEDPAGAVALCDARGGGERASAGAVVRGAHCLSVALRGVSMNHHTLADFRVAQVALLDRLLAQGVASLVSEGLVKLERLAQDGVRIRASAGSSSYRRRERWRACWARPKRGWHS
jgi:hypothetical protein